MTTDAVPQGRPIHVWQEWSVVPLPSHYNIEAPDRGFKLRLRIYNESDIEAIRRCLDLIEELMAQKENDQ